MESRGVHFAVMYCLLAGLCSGELPLPAQIDNPNNVFLTNQGQRKQNLSLDTITPTKETFPAPITSVVEDNVNNVHNSEEKKEQHSKHYPEPSPINTTHSVGEDLNSGKTADEQDVTLLEAVSAKVLVAQDHAIGVLDLFTDKRQRNMLEGGVNIYSVDFHWNKSLIFFATNTSIYSYNYHNQQGGTALKPIVMGRVDQSTQLAVDWIHDKLYWVCHKYQTVEMADLDGRNRRLLADNIKVIQFPNNIVVDPFEKLMFFVSNFTLFKVNLDKSKISRVRVDCNHPGKREWGIKNIAIDRVNKVIFTTGNAPNNAATNFKETVFINKIHYDGTSAGNHQKNLLINTTRWMDVYSMDVFRDTLYFAHYEQKRVDEIYALNLTTTDAEPQLKFKPRVYTDEIWSIKVFHPCVQYHPFDGQCS